MSAIAKSKDRFSRILMNLSKQPPQTRYSIFKPGGTMIGARGTVTGHILQKKNDRAVDTLGRWTVIYI